MQEKKGYNTNFLILGVNTPQLDDISYWEFNSVMSMKAMYFEY